MSVPALLARQPACFPPAPGDVVRMAVKEVLVVETGDLRHSQGYGPVEMRGVDLSDAPELAGTMINTPWGMIEIVAVDDRRYLAFLNECRRTRRIRESEPARLANPDDECLSEDD
jgi:hypothetical protein